MPGSVSYLNGVSTSSRSVNDGALISSRPYLPAGERMELRHTSSKLDIAAGTTLTGSCHSRTTPAAGFLSSAGDSPKLTESTQPEQACVFSQVCPPLVWLAWSVRRDLVTGPDTRSALAIFTDDCFPFGILSVILSIYPCRP